MTDKVLAPQAERLTLVTEESSEVGQAVAKVLRHGYESTNPDQPGSASNRKHLAKELGQHLLAMRMLVASGDVSEADVMLAMKQKAESIHQWLHHPENAELAKKALASSSLDLELAGRVETLQGLVKEKDARIADLRGAQSDLTARVKELEKQNAQLSSHNDQLLADVARQAGYIDRVLEQEAPQDVQMAPSDHRTQGVLIAKGPRIGGRHGSGIDHDHFIDRTRY
jgi:NTP pyrophosphatase (non-canonical NTP hydrolase)